MTWGSQAEQWDIAVGETLLRRDLHTRYGGGRQGGMEPSAQTPNVFLFTEPASGELYGYNFDGWNADGTFHYTGEGQVGDQVMTHGNKAALLHFEQGRALRVFQAEGRDVTYIGEFRLATDGLPHYPEEAPDRDRVLRRVIVFRLEPVGDHLPQAISASSAPAHVEQIAIEASDIEEFVQQHREEPVIAVRREAQLVSRYLAWLSAKHHEYKRHKVPTPGGATLYTDIFDLTTQELIEAKASSSRSNVRTGLGQILDYARFIEHESKALLFPTEPAPDLLDLLAHYDVQCIWEATDHTFERRSA